MVTKATLDINTDNFTLHSIFLERDVLVDCYYSPDYFNKEVISLLLVNDGQDLRTMQFQHILNDLYVQQKIEPVFCVGIHCAPDRKNEYGTANILDYKGRGAKAALFTQFVMQELIPFIRKQYAIISFKEKSFAGFSLGGLCALDIVWNHPDEFFKVGVFSGSLWWRDKDQEDPDFNEDEHRIMQRQVREGNYYPWLKFFFEVGTQDETADRNNNGVIDSIDDALSLIETLQQKGYTENDIMYYELQDGKHDVPTWAKAFPTFLQWGWGISAKS
ncbi:alpha/beta hydrolase [Ferruginibacter yonginensis]|uniref:Alpha/beta hydrolase n=1 Tax=Ferruginibacter yonginensis TaxID=1310416 RepID=A0ABV8QNI7_9BACT